MLDALPENSRSVTPLQVRPRRLALTRRDVLVGVLLLAVLLFGGFLRFYGTNWDDYVHFHPDERFMAGQVALSLGQGWLSFTDGGEEAQRAHCMAAYPESGGIGPFFDARCSTWNPHNIGAGHMAYGTFPFFVTRWTVDLLESAFPGSSFSSYDALPLVWRTLSAAYDTLTILLVFFIGLTLRSRWLGLLAALLYASAVLPIQIAHFATADAMTAMWAAFTVLFSVRGQKHGGVLNFALAGIGLGAAVASRANVAPLVLVVMAAAGLRMLPALDPRLPWSERNRAFAANFALLSLAGILTILVFRIFNPYAFIGPGFFGLMPNERWLDDLRQAQYETSPANGAPPQWQWVGRMRYQFAFTNIVLWGMGIALGAAAWIGWGLAGWRWIRRKPGITPLIPLFLWVLVYFAWVGGNFVMSMRYYLPLYSTLVIFAAWLLLEGVQAARRRPGVIRRALAWSAVGVVAGFTVLWALMFTNVYRNLATFTQASYWLWENAPGDFYMKVDERDDLPLVNIPLTNTQGVQNNLLSNATHLFPFNPVTVTFYPPESGTISTIYAPRIGALSENAGAASLRFTLSAPGSAEILAETILTDSFAFDPVRGGESYTVPLDQPVYVAAHEPYTFTVELIMGDTVATTGSVWTWEGAWDEAVPVQVCALPPGVRYTEISSGYFAPGECRKLNASANLVTTQQFEIVREDDELKRDEMLRLLEGTDYIIIGTNRRYDSNTRNLLRWPMTTAYYDALFSGELGFERVALFEETFELGPLKVSDQYLPFYDAPRWLNEFEVEEAFHVYDHPAVMIYQKTDAYSAQKAREILYGVSLNRPPSCGSYMCYDDPRTIGVVTWDVERASDTPTQIMFPEDMLAVQTEGGTWAERFNRASPINDGGVMSAVLWWLGVTALALVIAPYLFLAFPALADRGYGLARISAMLVIGWLGWLGANLRAPLWSAGGLWLITGVLAVGAALIVLRQRRQITAFVRARWRLLLTIEILGAALYVGFLLVRLSNPDLWTVGFGGEKPMDFAYFNAVLRSTIFPAIDPWHAGGYLNYYYFGYVVVGAPVLMFQVVPSIAYNLLIPTIAATLGLGGFSVAFALVSRWTRRGADGIQRPRANPYLAGIAALIMVTVLGNLDTPRVLLRGMADLGGYDASTTDMSWYLVENHRWQTGSPPDAETMAELSKRVDNPTLIDRVGYQLFHTPRFLGSIFTGAQRMFMDGQQPRIANDRWFWAPSRTITESVGGYAINEMPMFTFVYGDLHAHMISLPLMTLAIAFVFNELALAGREQRRLTGRFIALLLGAVTCGLFIAVNTWEYPTFMLFGVLGLGYAWWLTWRGLSRRALWHMLLTVGGFLVLAWLAALPYNHWFASAYNAVRPWEGSKTPLWAYFNIHGLFLFLITSLLVWESARWLRSARVRALTGRRNLIIGAGALLLAALIATVWLANRGPVVALIVVPLILWIGLLFFRPNQSIPMQFTLVIAGLALAITLGVEVVVLEGDIGRQNTVFKFYMQVWVLLSIAGGAAFAWLYDSINRWPGLVRNIWIFAGAAMLFAAVLFPLLSVPAKAVYRLSDETPTTLDGAAFMDYTTSYFEDTGIVDMQADARIIRWLQDNVAGSPAIMEAQSGDSYRWGNRISIQTGLPTVIGWNFHQRQQRGLDPLQEIVWQRMANVNNFYRTTNIADAWNILHHYNIKYLIVGGLERAVYGESGGLDKFAEMESLGLLRTVYQEGTAHIAAHIYEVNRAAGPLALAMRPADQPADQP